MLSWFHWNSPCTLKGKLIRRSIACKKPDDMQQKNILTDYKHLQALAILSEGFTIGLGLFKTQSYECSLFYLMISRWMIKWNIYSRNIKFQTTKGDSQIHWTMVIHRKRQEIVAWNWPTHLEQEAISFGHLVDLVFMVTQHLNFFNSWYKLQKLQVSVTTNAIICRTISQHSPVVQALN